MFSRLIMLFLILMYIVACRSGGNGAHADFDRVSFSAVPDVPAESNNSDYKSDQIPDTNGINCSHMCRCSETVANCSANFGNLTFVPELPGNISVLIFSYNNLVAIERNNFFTNATNITVLDLSHNGLSYVCSGTFTLLERLENLTLDFNNIKKNTLHEIKSVKTLKFLSLTSVYINMLKLSYFSSLPLLTMIQLSSCDIAIIKTGNISSLTHLQLHYNKVSIFPETCRNGSSLFYNLLVLNLSVNVLDNIGVVCLPNLQVLDLSSNRFVRIEADTFNIAYFPSLTRLVIESITTMGIYVIIEKNAFSSPKIQFISLVGGDLLFPNDNNVHPEAFQNCSALETLQLSGNVFEGISDEKFYKLFANLTSLRKLYITFSYIRFITKDTFKALSNINELYLHGNSLLDIPDGAFSHMTNLTVLHLGGNKLTTIRETSFDSRTIQIFQEVDLSGNPFVCSCDIKWFRQWFLSNPSIFFKNKPDRYRCVNLPKISLAAFVLPDQACMLSSEAFTLTVVSVCLVLIMLITYGVLYRLRWHIRLLLYEAFRSRKGDQRHHYLITGDFAYDVFVSYAAEDLHWVRDYLIPELEVKMGLRLCIHQRNFVPGVNISDNIVNNLEKSKKVLMIFSTHFARSQWCQFELALCLQHVMDHDDILVIVYLDDLQNRFLTSTMFAVLKVTTCIQWDDNPDARASFWGRMKIAFREILPQK